MPVITIARPSSTVLAMLGLAALGCSGLLGYGAELADSSVQDGQAFELSLSPTTEAMPRSIWLDYTVEHSAPYHLYGTLELVRDGEAAQSWTVDLSEDGSPVVGESGRVTLNAQSSSFNGDGRAQATIKLTSLPDLAPGSFATLRGTLTADGGTTLTSARVVVTD